MPKLRRRGGDGGPRRAPPARAGEARAVAKGERRRASRTPSPFFCSLPFSLSRQSAAAGGGGALPGAGGGGGAAAGAGPTPHRRVPDGLYRPTFSVPPPHPQR